MPAGDPGSLADNAVTPRIAWYLWLLAPALPVLFFAVMYEVDQPPSLDEQWAIGAISFIESVQPNLPSDDAGWRDSDFPVRIYNPQRKVVTAWLRSTFDYTPDRTESISPDTDRDRWAVFLPRCFCNVDVWINNVKVGSGGAFTLPMPQYRRPLIFDFPTAILQETDNQIVMRFGRESTVLRLTRTYVGPRTGFVPTYNHGWLMLYWIPLVIFGFMVVLSMIMGLLWLQRRDERAYGWYALMLLFWSIHHGEGLIDHIPFLTNGPFYAVSYATLGLFVVCAALFAERFGNHSHPRIEFALLAWGVIGTAFLVTTSLISWNLLLNLARSIWVPSLNLIGVWIFYLLIRGAIRSPSFDTVSMMVISLLVLIVGVRDYLFEIYPSTIPGSDYYLKYAAGGVLLLFSFILMRRFARALSEAEILNRDLEQRVAEKAAALEQNFEALGRVTRERDIANERERIMRDMHDGIGAHLVQALTTAEQIDGGGQLNEILKSALGDLRLIIDSMAPNDGDLLAVLATFRERMQPTLRLAGLELDWQVTDVPKLHDLGPEQTLQILRILQEAITNALKHAHPSKISVATGVREIDGYPTIWMEIADDGVGFDADDDRGKSSRGLGNMRARASRIGAELLIDSTPGSGTHVTLILPVGITADT